MSEQSATFATRRRLLRSRLADSSSIGLVAATLRQGARDGKIPSLGLGGYMKAARAVVAAGTDASDEELDSFVADAWGTGDGTGFDLFETKVGAKLSADPTQAPTPTPHPFLDILAKLLPLLLPLLTGCVP